MNINENTIDDIQEQPQEGLINPQDLDQENKDFTLQIDVASYSARVLLSSSLK